MKLSIFLKITAAFSLFIPYVYSMDLNQNDTITVTLSSGKEFVATVKEKPDYKENWVKVTLSENGKEYFLNLNQVALVTFEGSHKQMVENKIRKNLKDLQFAAKQFYLETKKTPKFGDLVGNRLYIKVMTPVDGEDYSILPLANDTDTWTVVTKSGYKVIYDWE